MKKLRWMVPFYLFDFLIIKAQIIAPKVQSFMDNEVKKLWPLGLGSVVIIGFISSVNLFFGENKDIQKGFVRMLTVMAGITLAGVIVAWVLKLKIE